MKSRNKSESLATRLAKADAAGGGGSGGSGGALGSDDAPGGCGAPGAAAAVARGRMRRARDLMSSWIHLTSSRDPASKIRMPTSHTC